MTRLRAAALFGAFAFAYVLSALLRAVTATLAPVFSAAMSAVSRPAIWSGVSTMAVSLEHDRVILNRDHALIFLVWSHFLR